jgi:hypothetical protein
MMQSMAASYGLKIHFKRQLLAGKIQPILDRGVSQEQLISNLKTLSA